MSSMTLPISNVVSSFSSPMILSAPLIDAPPNNFYLPIALCKDFTQTYGINYIEMFSLVVCLNSICVFLSLVVFIEQPLRYRVVSCSSEKFEYLAIFTNVFMKSLANISYDATCTKLDMFDLYALT
ncbi:unnamed protein product [Spirodela intermedia]|uniref:Uncharacterized protein n=1 Tax=Spirodela intermedia TaxID=51605 RepID=A0A7I8LL38_SPIIN|nr:unnamed protein product [Spirodela intermedia]